ncbi:hypothetical protein FXO38_16413 [Capsicum annuum]|uniref:U-box domain-containing protein n=1 Tax=Capsicum annuum TaxID=4072 RepID=A0A2G2Y8H8_CAPAN|nr:hypothetical protein FXO38_16413 [Capsicum annuum]KAF3670251.1 hypothetical protein FXO37_08634 [Capsicum annuum]PHT66032.1 hypothetical protein T459_30457 [Capsicum annuum]
MGCVYGKPSRSVKDWRDGQKKRELDKGASTVDLKREKSFRVKDKLENGNIRVGSFYRKPNGSKKVGDDHYEKVNGMIGSDNLNYAELDVMEDPHIVADGYTYEGDKIKGWMYSGQDTSPMTSLKLDTCH